MECILEEDRGETLVDVVAYCLMPNHFHLLLREKKEGGITAFMLKLSTGYSMYFNKKYERTGALFEGRFKARHVGEDEYLKYLFAYIHLNPIKILDPKWRENRIEERAEAKEFLEKYRYSSYFDYRGVDRKEGNILNKKAAPEYFEDISFEEYVDTWMDFSDAKE